MSVSNKQIISAYYKETSVSDGLAAVSTLVGYPVTLVMHHNNIVGVTHEKHDVCLKCGHIMPVAVVHVGAVNDRHELYCDECGGHQCEKI